jgi:Holliday junction resolvase
MSIAQYYKYLADNASTTPRKDVDIASRAAEILMELKQANREQYNITVELFQALLYYYSNANGIPLPGIESKQMGVEVNIALLPADLKVVIDTYFCSLLEI